MRVEGEMGGGASRLTLMRSWYLVKRWMGAIRRSSILSFCPSDAWRS